MIARAALIWVLLLCIAVGAGILRTALLTPRTSEQQAHVIGTLFVVAIFAVVIWTFTPWIVPSLQPGKLLWLGVGWTTATVLFEFIFGRYVAGHSWSRLVADYDVTAGRIWILVLLTELVTPSIATLRP